MVSATTWCTCTDADGTWLTTCGEHKEKTLKEVHDSNKSYLRWIVRKVRRVRASPRGRFRCSHMPVRTLSQRIRGGRPHPPGAGPSATNEAVGWLDEAIDALA